MGRAREKYSSNGQVGFVTEGDQKRNCELIERRGLRWDPFIKDLALTVSQIHTHARQTMGQIKLMLTELFY